MRSLMLVGGGILIGVGLAYGDATIRAEKAARERYDEALESHKKAMDMSETLREAWTTEAPAEQEEELIFNADGAVLAINTEQELPPGYVQEYVEKAAVYGDSAHMVQAQPMEIIDDDLYAEEDGRAKEQITVFMGDGEPYFVQDGMVIEDWREKIGDNVLVMFYQNFGPDAKERVIYVRNHERGEDFEVIQEMGP